MDEGSDDYNSYNLGTKVDPKMVKIDKVYSDQERKEMLQLLTDYKEGIEWSYEDLKTYDLDIITHNMPLNLYAKPFY